jgi:hypothetical protein
MSVHIRFCPVPYGRAITASAQGSGRSRSSQSLRVETASLVGRDFLTHLPSGASPRGLPNRARRLRHHLVLEVAAGSPAADSYIRTARRSVPSSAPPALPGRADRRDGGRRVHRGVTDRAISQSSRAATSRSWGRRGRCHPRRPSTARRARARGDAPQPRERPRRTRAWARRAALDEVREVVAPVAGMSRGSSRPSCRRARASSVGRAAARRIHRAPHAGAAQGGIAQTSSASARW